MKKELREKIEKAKLLSFSLKDIEKQLKFKGKKKKKKSSKVTASKEHKKKGESLTAEELDETLEKMLNVKP